MICFENEKFFKIDKSQNFQNFLSETKQTNISTTANVNQAISTLKHQSVIENNFNKFKTSYLDSAKKTENNHNSNCSHKSDKKILINIKKQLRLFDKIINTMKKILKQNASRKQSIGTKLKNTLKRIIIHQIRNYCGTFFKIVNLHDHKIQMIQYVK